MALIRKATTDDVADLLALVEQYWAFEGIAGFDAPNLGAVLMRLLSTPHLGVGWIARDGSGEAVGYLVAIYAFSLEHQGLTAEIDELFILPDWRGDGLGGQLLKTAEQEFLAQGCTNVALQIGRGNAGARRFYRGFGYGERSGFELHDKMLR